MNISPRWINPSEHWRTIKDIVESEVLIFTELHFAFTFASRWTKQKVRMGRGGVHSLGPVLYPKCQQEAAAQINWTYLVNY